MADETYRPRKIVPEPGFEENREESGSEKLASGQAMREQIAADNGESAPVPQGGLDIQGGMPPGFQEQISAAKGDNSSMKPSKRRNAETPPKREKKLPFANDNQLVTNDSVSELLKRVQPFVEMNFDEITLPSAGKFYDGEDGPTDGVLHVRPMTGKEEQILATPRWVKGGKAMDMIFESCLQEDYDPVNFLSIDRTYLLIFLRGISYTPEYEVEIKCPDCSTKYSSVIHLNELPVDECKSDFGPDKLDDTLPTTGFSFGYRLSTGFDENEVSRHRERKAKWFGDRTTDDTLLFRMASLIDYIEEVDGKKDIQLVLEKLPVSDVNYIRNVVNEPPFGVDTKIPQVCVSCMSEFDIDLPLEANFFFPRRVREES